MRATTTLAVLSLAAGSAIAAASLEASLTSAAPSPRAAQTPEEGRALLGGFDFPFRKDEEPAQAA